MMQLIQEYPFAIAEDRLSAIEQTTMRLQGLHRQYLTVVRLTDEAGIKQINASLRGMDQVTDVLSFPNFQLNPQNTLTDDHGGHDEAYDSDENAYFLGDIVVCVPRLIEQARQIGQSPLKEMDYLLLHGLFHLMGYDHNTPKEKKSMREMEKRALSALEDPSFQKEDLMALARQAKEESYSPYSHFRVGAALLCDDGRIFTGVNVENASFGLTNCAERTAVFKAISEGCRDFKAIAIASDDIAAWPCGACRQVLAEFAPHIKVYLIWGDQQSDESDLSTLLPHGFTSLSEDKTDE